jgi:hypothetical protein
LFYTASFISSRFFSGYPITQGLILNFLCPTVIVLAAWKSSITQDPKIKFPWKKNLIAGFVFFLSMVLSDVLMEDMVMKKFTAILLFVIFLSYLFAILYSKRDAG